MQVVFGWDLDGPCFPETPSGEFAAFNAAVLGPRGLLGLLETKLGLRRATEQRAVRVAQYLRMLQAADDGDQFFSNSLNVDPWATAEKLLQARDELITAGWDGSEIRGLLKVASLARVEKSGHVAPGFGERLRDVVDELRRHQKRLVDRIEVVGGLDLLPRPLQVVFEQLRLTGTAVLERPRTAEPSSSDLSIVRQLLRDRTSTSLSVRGDGSFVVLDADDELQAAELLAAWLKQQGQRKDVVIVRGADSSALNSACQRYSLPLVGSTMRSEFRSVLQVLSFAFEMAWRPIDPRRLAEFLTLDGGPMPFWEVASQLLRAIHEQPGIGGPLWLKAWEQIEKAEIDAAQRADASKGMNEAERDAKAKLDEWKAWFDPKVASLSDKISVEDAGEICRRVAKWASRRAAHSEQSVLYEIATRHARLLNQLIVESGQAAFSLTQLRKMIGAVIAYGVTAGGAEEAEWSLIDQPGQIWGAAPTVIWWQFAQATAQSVRLSAWSSTEIEALRERGIYIDTPLQRLRRDSVAWQAPLWHATERLIIVKPRMVAGQSAIPHPLWDEICSVLDEKQLRWATARASDLYASSKFQFAGGDLECGPKPAIRLPGPRRNWQLPPGTVTARETKESFTSIDRLLGCSLMWTLEYRGQMRQPQQLDITQKETLIGKLAHAVIDALYKERKRWKPEEARARAEEILREYIPERAAALLLPGAGPQYRQAFEAIPSAVQYLTEVLNESDLRVHETEAALEAKFLGERVLGGGADMVAYMADNTPVILDFKWSSAPHFFRKKIAKGEALQLAVYAYLASAFRGASGDLQDEDWPPVGYFMLRGKEIYFTQDGVLSRGGDVPKQARTMKETWTAMLAEYDRELTAVTGGKVTAYGVDHDDANLVDFMRTTLNEPPCRFCKLGYICGKKELQ